MKTLLFFLSSVIFLGCSGGGGSTTQTSEPTTYTLSGTVPGTVIEAYCNDGSFYKTTSVVTDTNEHPFSLQLPANLECKLVMITNEDAVDPADYVITPIQIEVNGDRGTYLRINQDVDFGYIPLQTPQDNPNLTLGIQETLTIRVDNESVSVISLVNDPMDNDNDGLINVYEDDDNDGQLNKYDDDSIDADDSDHDGIDDLYDVDDNNDGIEDSNDEADSNDEEDSNDEAEDSKDDEQSEATENDDENSETSSSTQELTVVLPNSFNADSGRLLGSQCAQCHGTNGVSSSGFDSIVGENDLYHEMFDDDELMTAQAKGYTINEVNSIELWLNNISSTNSENEESEESEKAEHDEDDEDDEHDEDDEEKDDD